jgi:macrolide transport system ATP-binding/permease protein
VNPVLLEARNLTKVYRPTGKDKGALSVRALDAVDLDIRAGEYVAIVGPSGSGKSTLMQMLGLLDRPTSGTLRLDGQDVSALSDDQLASIRNHRIGFIFQFFNLLARTSALANVSLPLIYGRNPDPAARARELLVKVGLEDRMGHAPHQLSGGQQQRVAIARALANAPSLIFADEPTGNISSQHAAEVMKELDQLNRQGATIVLVTHDPQVAAHARRLVRVMDGRIVEDTVRDPFLPEVPASPSSGDRRAGAAFIPSLAGFRENLGMGLTALTLNKMRTILTMLGVIIGVAAVISMTAIGNGATAAVQARLAALGSNLLVVLPGNPAANSPGSKPRFTMREPQALKQLVKPGSSVLMVDPAMRGDVVAAAGNRNTSTSLLGCESSYEVMRASRPVSGRFFTEQEDKAREKVCLLGKTVVKNLFDEGFDPTGSTIKLNHTGFKVLGVLPTKGASWKDDDDIIIIPLQTALHRVLGGKYIHYVDMQARSADRMQEAIDDGTDALRKARRLPAYKPDDFQMRNMADIQAAQTDTANTLTTLIDSIAMLSLCVGGIGIMNIMLVSVRERTKEIGLRKALGARNLEVLFQFLVEALLIGTIGGMIGIALGSLTAVSLAWFRGWPVLLPWGTVAIAVVFSAATGVAFGLWPAWQASRLSPIEALRYE